MRAKSATLGYSASFVVGLSTDIVRHARKVRTTICIAIYKPENVYLKKYILQTCFENHPDGAGFMVYDHKAGRLIAKKGFFSFRSFWKAYREYKYHRAVLHFRYSTAGKVNEENCHPFLANDNLGFVHNGTIGIQMDDKDFSDTWHFNENVLKPIIDEYPDAWMHKTIKGLVESFITERNKLVFMDGSGNVTIYNEGKGVWHSECWFSNDSYTKKMVRRADVGACGTDSCDVGTKSYKGTYHKGSSGQFSDSKRSRDEILLERLMAEAEAEELGELASNKDNVASDSSGKPLVNLGKGAVDSLAEELEEEMSAVEILQ